MPALCNIEHDSGAKLWVRGMVFAGIYGALAKGGLVLASLHGNVSPVWPATGFAMWLLLGGGRRWWPAVALGALATNACTDIPLYTAALIAAGNTAEALVGAWMIEIFRLRVRGLGELADPVGLVAGGVAGSLVGAGVGVTSLLMTGAISGGAFQELWLTWFLGDALGALCVLPLLSSITEGKEERRGGRRAWRQVAVWLTAGGICVWVFFYPAGHAWVFLIYPVLLLAGLALGHWGVRLAVVVVAVVAVTAAVIGAGPFVTGRLNADLLRMQGFLVSVAVTALALPLFRRPGRWLPVGVLLGGWAISGWVFIMQTASVEAESRQHLADLAADASDQIVRRMETYQDALRSGVGLYASTKVMTRQKWRTFAKSLELTDHYPGMNGIGVILPVKPEELEAFVAAVRADGVPEFAPKTVPHVTPPDAPAGAPRYLITYIEPWEPNRLALGLDVATEINRREAVEQARDTGKPVITRRITLVQDDMKRIGFLLYAPVYADGIIPGEVAARRNALVGWVYAPFTAYQFLLDAIGRRSNELSLHFYEGRSVAAADLLYETDKLPPGMLRPELTTEITMAGEVFTLGWHRRADGYVTPDSNTPVYLASGMAFITLLLAGLILSLQDTGWRAQQVVAERTAELAAVNRLQRAVLDGTVHSIISTDPEGVIVTFNVGAEAMLGYQQGEVVGQHTPALFHDPVEVAARAEELSRELGRFIAPGFDVFVAKARRGEIEEREWTYVRKDGQRVAVQLSVTALRDVRGTITGFLGLAYDLTERKRMEEDIRRKEERLRLAGEAAGVAVWDWDIESGAIHWDQNMFSLYGVAPTADGYVTYETWARAVHPDDIAAQEEQLRATVETLGGGRREFRIRRGQDQSLRHVQAAEMVIRNREGRPLRVIGVNLDVSERKRIELALRSSEEQLQNVFRAMAEGLVLQDRHGAIIHCNVAAERILGMTREQMLGRTPKDAAWQVIRPDGTPFPAEERPAMVTLRTRKACHDVVMGIGKADGRVTWISVNTEPSLAADGQVEFVVGTISDITERLEAEKELHTLALIVSRTSNAVLLTDAQRRVEWVNEGFTRLSGYTLEEMRGQVPGKILQGADTDAAVVAHIHDSLARGESCEVEIKNYRKNGQAYWIRTEIQPIRNAQGKIERWMAIQLDVTEHKALEASLAVARDQALEAARLKAEFLASMSHEIRTPMNGIIGMSGLLMETLEKPEQREMGLVIQNSAEGLLTIINDILDFSRIEAGKLRMEAQEFELRALVEESLALLAPRAHQKNLELLCEIDPRLAVVLLGDAGRLRQVLLNLVGNAIKFTERGDVFVSAWQVAEHAPWRTFRLEVRDTGIGIPIEAQRWLFQPFTQADGSITRRFGGTGLGLAISRQLVELMGGDIGFASTEGTGSTFWCQLSMPTQPTQPPSLPSLPPGLNVLVVDDHATSRQIILDMLRHFGVPGVAVGSAPEAMLQLHVAIQQQAPFNVVILDGQMPGQDGVGLALAIRSNPSFGHLLLILLSPSQAVIDAEAMARIRFEVILIKPVREAALHRALTQAAAREKPAIAPAPGTPIVSLPPSTGRGLHLLLAEDNPTNQIVACRLLEKLGHKIEVAQHGGEAVERLQHETYDAVLMDCQMPIMDGYTATQQIRANEQAAGRPRQPIIALTAYAMPSDRLKCFSVGMDDYVAKPLRLEELQQAFSRLGLQSGGAVPSPRTVESIELDQQQIDQLRELPGRKYPTLLLDLIEIFLTDAPAMLAALTTGVEQRNQEESARLAHRLAGSSASLGSPEMRKAALAVEFAARAGDWPMVKEAMATLDEKWKQTMVALQKLQPSSPS